MNAVAVVSPGASLSPRRPLRYETAAGVSGLLALVVGMGSDLISGAPPELGASTADVAAFFARNPAGHKLGVVGPALIGIPIVLFFIGVYRTLVQGDRRSGSSWAPLFLYGAIMMSATAGLGEGLFAIAALRGGAGLAPEVVRLLNDGSQIARATVGVWMAVAMIAVAAATFQHKLRPTWYGWYCAFSAALGAIGVTDAVALRTNGIFSKLSFLAGFVLWMAVTSVLQLRDGRVPQTSPRP